MALNQVIEESLATLARRKKRLIAEKLTLPAGTIVCRRIGGQEYVYRNRRDGKVVRTAYLGRQSDAAAKAAVAQGKRRRIVERELKETIANLKRLRMNKSLSEHDYVAVLSRLYAEFTRRGLWEYGVELIGTWCFRVYAEKFRLNVNPELTRTLDVDFLIQVPYEGPDLDIDGLLDELGFIKKFKHDMSVYYEGAGLEIEFLTPTRNKRGKAMAQDIPQLRVRPEPVELLDILFKNPMTIALAGGEKVKTPSLPAFMLQKMMIACTLWRMPKKRKDQSQIEAVAQEIARTPALVKETKALMQGLKEGRCQVARTLKDMQNNFPEYSGALTAVFKQAVPRLLEECGEEG